MKKYPRIATKRQIVKSTEARKTKIKENRRNGETMQEKSDSNQKLPSQKLANTIDISISVPPAVEAEEGRVSEGVENRMRTNAAEHVTNKLEKDQ